MLDVAATLSVVGTCALSAAMFCASPPFDRFFKRDAWHARQGAFVAVCWLVLCLASYYFTETRMEAFGHLSSSVSIGFVLCFFFEGLQGKLKGLDSDYD